MMGSLSCENTFGEEAVAMCMVNRHHSAKVTSDSACLLGLGRAMLECWPCRMVATKSTRNQTYAWGLKSGHEPLTQPMAKPFCVVPP